MLERMWNQGNTPPLLVGVETYTVTLEISVEVSEKIGTSRPSNTTAEHIPKGCSVIPQGHVLNNVPSSIICNCQNLDTT